MTLIRFAYASASLPPVPIWFVVLIWFLYMPAIASGDFSHNVTQQAREKKNCPYIENIELME